MELTLDKEAVAAIESIINGYDEAIVKRENGRIVVIRCVRSLKYKAAEQKQESK